MKTCIIVGNGPTALNVPAVDDAPLFGMNFTPIYADYYICIDTVVLTQHWKQIYQHAARARIAYLSAYHKASSPLYELVNVQLVDKDTETFAAERFMSGFTAAYVALKCAYYLGFEEVHLFGVDHSPAWEHYKKDYPYGDTTTPARMLVMEDHYRLAAAVYARAGRRIINHSNPSRLDAIFERGT